MGLIIFYDLTKDELRGRRPLAKFLCIKLIVMVTWYQSFLFGIFQTKGVIKATEFWTSANIADGLNALATCIEMVIFAIFMWWAYPATEYYNKTVNSEEQRKTMSDDEKERRKHDTTSIWRPLLDSINFSDFAQEIWSSFVFFVDYARGKPHAHSQPKDKDRVTFGSAFGVEPQPRKKLSKPRPSTDPSSALMRPRTPNSEAGTATNVTWSGGARSTEEGETSEAYRMSPITSQPQARQPPWQQQQGQQQLLPPGQQQSPDPNQRWSTIGLAM
jgi:hypothetical protein